MELIKHAAVKSKDGTVFKGKSHADCFYAGDGAGHKMSSHPDDQGFVTDLGRYVGREEAFKIAQAADQISNDLKHGMLFSEDMWCKTDGGQHEYDYDMGYYK